MTNRNDTMSRAQRRAIDPALDCMYKNAAAIGITESQVDLLFNLFVGLLQEMHKPKDNPESTAIN